MQRISLCGALGAALAAFSAAAPAQVTLKPVVVTGNPLGSTELGTPAQALSGQSLLLRGQATLGETLNQLPGVASTYFGPTASRPVIRGLDGDRVRILNNSGAALDASSLSYDHAVASDPIAVERIEVLRGPAALLYGGNAIGGVVNMIDNRIPREPLTGVGGKVDLGAASGARERGGAVMVEGGNERAGLHVDVSRRTMGETRVPLALPCTQGGSTLRASRICNSGAETEGAALGGSLFLERGFIGLSASTYRSAYGAVSEDEVTIDMRSDRLALEGELRDIGGWLSSVKLRAGHSDYRHAELEAGVAGTVFENRGNDLRLEARHRDLGPLQGVIGLQAESARFSADGEEAFAPHSRTRQRALFVFEELPLSWGKFTFGARTEDVAVDSLGSPAAPRFAPASRSFRPFNAAAGLSWNVAPGWQLTGNAARSERAPRDYELYADGPHIATGAYEIGNLELGKERSTHLELGLQWKSGPHSLRVNAYRARFENYIALLATGGERGAEEGEPALPEFAYQAVRARFHGAEADGVVRLWDRGATVDLEWRADAVRATNDTTGEPMPRIAPLRAGATLAYERGSWTARFGFDHVARQDRVPAGGQATDGYTLWNAAVTYQAQLGGSRLLWYARLENAADRLAYSATSILTQTAPGRVPLPGRSLKVGVRAAF